MHRRAWKAALVLILLSAIAGAQQARKITGTVTVAATGRPVSNALVQYEEQSGDGLVRTTRTDSKGQFEFESGRLGVVTVAAQGFGTARQAWPPRRGVTLHFALKTPVTIQGTLTDSYTAGPLDGSVTAVTRHPSNLVYASARVRGGTFRFDDLPEGPVLILAHADERAPSITQLTTSAGDWRDVHISLGADARASGNVLDAYGEPVEGAFLVADYGPSVPGGGMLSGIIGGSVITDDEGTFALNGLAPGTPVAIYAIKGGRETGRASITVYEGMVYDGLVLRLR